MLERLFTLAKLHGSIAGFLPMNHCKIPAMNHCRIPCTLECMAGNSLSEKLNDTALMTYVGL
jgi:hypothetical protein